MLVENERINTVSQEISLTQQLVSIPSVTPFRDDDEEMLNIKFKNLREVYRALGKSLTPSQMWSEIFMVNDEKGIPSLPAFFAHRYLGHGPYLLFLGHADVVAPSIEYSLTEPLNVDIHEGIIRQRGTADMKVSIAAFAVACNQVLTKLGQFGTNGIGGIGMLVVGDEEEPFIGQGSAENALHYVKDRIARFKNSIGYVIVGEPSNVTEMSQQAYNARRGNILVNFQIQGKGGHTARPEHIAQSPYIPAARIMDILQGGGMELDNNGNTAMQRTTFCLNDLRPNTDGKASNVIPSQVTLRYDVRNNETHPLSFIQTYAERIAMMAVEGLSHLFKVNISVESVGAPYNSLPGRLAQSFQDATHELHRTDLQVCCGGGTSDGRFVQAALANEETDVEVIEYSVPALDIHATEERATVKDIVDLKTTYALVMNRLLRG